MTAERHKSGQAGRWKYWLASLILFALVAGLYVNGNLTFLEHKLTDQRFALTKRPATGNVVLVEIDAKSIAEIGVWPWPRRHHATVVDRLSDAGAGRIALDVDFSARSTPEDDALLAEAFARARHGVILPAFAQHSSRLGNDSGLVASLPFNPFRQNAVVTSINVSPSEDGLIRELDVAQTITRNQYPALATLLARVEVHAFDFYDIDYGIQLSTVPHLSFSDVLHGRFDPAVVVGKQVVVGSTAAELGDQFAVPHYRSIPGPLVHILGYETLAQGRALHRLEPWLIIAATLLLTIAGCYLYSLVSWRIGLIAMTVVVGGLFGLSVLVQQSAPILLDIAPMILMVCLTYGVSVLRHIDRQSMALMFQSLDIRRKDAMMRHVVEGSAHGIVTLSESGVIQSINSAVTNIFGYSEDELVGLPVDNLFDLDVKNEPRSPGIIESTLSAGGFQEVIGRPKSGDEIFIGLTVNELALDDRKIRTAFLRDITVRKRQEQKLEYQATHDALTGLLNRPGLTTQFAQQLDLSADETAMGALFLLNLDRFKNVNNTLGYAVGDSVLRTLANHLSEHLPRRATLARFGGDEFVVLLPQLSSVDAVEDLGHSLLDEIQQPLTIDDVTLDISATIGAAIYPWHGASVEDLYQHANIAMNTAKQNQTAFARYDPKIDPHNVRNLTLTGDLRRAIDSDDLGIVYQPKIDIRQGRVYGAEALSRWHHAEHGTISPDEFVEHAEQTGLILPLTKSVLNAALKQASAWRNLGHDLNIAVNLSAKLLHHPAVIPTVVSALKKWDHPAQCLTLELTENAFLDNPQQAMDVVHQFVAMGIAVSIDDFGTGYSSLSYLKNLAAHELKIDKSFVLGIDRSSSDRTIVKSVVSMAHDLGLKVVAEGVESADSLEILTGLQCDIGQGYYFGRPMAPSEFEAWLNHSEWSRRPGGDASRYPPARGPVANDLLPLRETSV